MSKPDPAPREAAADPYGAAAASAARLAERTGQARYDAAVVLGSGWVPAADAVMHAAMAETDYALPGIEDVRILTGLTDPGAMLDFYLRLGPKVVVLKMGESGAYLATPAHRVRIPRHAVQVVDATGAGDAFCGSFLARMLAGDTPEQAARYANVAAALKCTGYGAVAPIPRPPDVLAALQGVAGNV